MENNTVKLSDLIPDNLNANQGTARGRKSTKQSLKEYGAGRSVLVDKDNRIIAGNKSVEAAEVLPSDDVIMVETDGTKLVVVKRTDLSLDDPKARELAIADNRSSELGLEWDVPNLQALGVDLGKFWDDGELSKLLNEPPSDAADEKLPEGFGILISDISEQQQLELLDRLVAEGFTCKSMVF